ncbi:DUF1499 domain-containing protein [Halomonas salinarum]|uniref:DUF1499 domain-containing protein n=1 Tax=Halomonas salinarum TaxID=1158993 RepID=UPI001439399E|nr:DUF1499 domain-containing protein [Halomonas salinarum]
MITNPLTSKRPDNLGIHDGHLADCDDWHSSVSSEAEDATHHVDPIQLGDRTPAQLMKRLQTAIAGCEQAEVVTATDTYLHAECHSPLGFIDDLEFFWSEDDGVCHVRSASRLGLTDLGKNRARVEKIRMLLEGWGFCD